MERENLTEPDFRFQRLVSPEDCGRLEDRLPDTPVVALWATVEPRQNVDILLALEASLRRDGIPVLFLMRENAVEFVRQYSPGGENFFIFEDKQLFRFLPGISLLVTHDYVLGHSRVDGFSGKTLLLNHASLASPESAIALDLYADYLIVPHARFQEPFDYSLVPNRVSIQHNPQLTVIPAGSPKLDLLAAARRRAYAPHTNIVSFYPASSDFMLGKNPAKINSVVQEWSAFVEAFLSRYPDGTFVFSPALRDHGEDFIRDFVKSWRNHKRFIFSRTADNKYWLSRTDFLLTDWSSISNTWALTSLRPAIRLQPGREAALTEDIWGYTAFSPAQALGALDLARKNLWRWKTRLLHYRTKRFPAFGQCMTELPNAIRHILSADFPAPLPSWRVLDKKASPENSIHNILRVYCARKAMPAGREAPHPAYLWDKILEIGSGCLTLAGLDEFIAYLSKANSLNEFDMSRWKRYTILSLSRCPQNICYKFFLHKVNRYKTYFYIIATLAVIAASRGSTTEQRKHVSDLIRQTDIDIIKVSDFFHGCHQLEDKLLSREYFGQIQAHCTSAQ